MLTGSTSSIGFEIGAQLAEAGVPRIMLNGRDAKRGADAVARLQKRAPKADVRFVAADSTKYEGAKQIVDATIVVVSIERADVMRWPNTIDVKPCKALDALVSAHFMSVIYTCHAALSHLVEREGGVIINLSSDAAKIATPGEAVIGGSKAGTLMFTRTMALEQSRHGIRVNAITPSIVAGTDAYDRLMGNEFTKRLFKKAEEKAKLGVVTPADIAPLAVFLAGPGAAKITGQGISVNGGISAA